MRPHVGGFCNALHHRTEHHITFTSQSTWLKDAVSETVVNTEFVGIVLFNKRYLHNRTIILHGITKNF